MKYHIFREACKCIIISKDSIGIQTFKIPFSHYLEIIIDFIINIYVLGWDLAIAQFQPRPFRQLGLRPTWLNHSFFYFSFLNHKCFYSVTKVLLWSPWPSLITKVFLCPAYLFHSLRHGCLGHIKVFPFLSFFYSPLSLTLVTKVSPLVTQGFPLKSSLW